MADRVEKVRRLLWSEGRHLAALNFGQPLLEGVAWVAADKLLLDGAGKGGAQNAVHMPARSRRQPAFLAVATAAGSPLSLAHPTSTG